MSRRHGRGAHTRGVKDAWHAATRGARTRWDVQTRLFGETKLVRDEFSIFAVGEQTRRDEQWFLVQLAPFFSLEDGNDSAASPHVGAVRLEARTVVFVDEVDLHARGCGGARVCVCAGVRGSECPPHALSCVMSHARRGPVFPGTARSLAHHTNAKEGAAQQLMTQRTLPAACISNSCCNLASVQACLSVRPPSACCA